MGAAARLALEGIQLTARTQGTPFESMEGVVSPMNGDDHASAHFEPQGGKLTKQGSATELQGRRGAAAVGIEIDMSEWTFEDWCKDQWTTRRPLHLRTSSMSRRLVRGFGQVQTDGVYHQARATRCR